MMAGRDVVTQVVGGWIPFLLLFLIVLCPAKVMAATAVAEKIVCLLIHGFAGSTVEMKPLALALEAEGCDVVRLTLPGHATSIDDFSRTLFPDWRAAAERACEEAIGRRRRVVVIGHSMGGSLALHLAQRYDLAGVVTLAAPVYLYRFLPPEATDWRLPLVGFLKHFRPRWPKAARILLPERLRRGGGATVASASCRNCTVSSGGSTLLRKSWERLPSPC